MYNVSREDVKNAGRFVLCSQFPTSAQSGLLDPLHNYNIIPDYNLPSNVIDPWTWLIYTALLTVSNVHVPLKTAESKGRQWVKKRVEVTLIATYTYIICIYYTWPYIYEQIFTHVLGHVYSYVHNCLVFRILSFVVLPVSCTACSSKVASPTEQYMQRYRRLRGGNWRNQSCGHNSR